jgi:hypothetical protein
MMVNKKEWAARSQVAAERLSAAIKDWSNRYQLTHAEICIILDAVIVIDPTGAIDRATIAAMRQISSATLKNHIHAILAKTGFRSLPDLIAQLLREHAGLSTRIDRT